MDEPAAPALDISRPAVRGAGLGCPSGAVRAAAGRVTDGHAVALAVSEAVTNVVIHAYRDRHHGLLGEVQVTATIDGEELLVSVADEEMGMRPRPDSPGAGLRLPIIAALADRFPLQQRPGRHPATARLPAVAG